MRLSVVLYGDGTRVEKDKENHEPVEPLLLNRFSYPKPWKKEEVFG